MDGVVGRTSLKKLGGGQGLVHELSAGRGRWMALCSLEVEEVIMVVSRRRGGRMGS